MKLILDSGEELELKEIQSNIYIFMTYEEMPPLPIQIRTTVSKSNPPPKDLGFEYRPYWTWHYEAVKISGKLYALDKIKKE